VTTAPGIRWNIPSIAARLDGTHLEASPASRNPRCILLIGYENEEALLSSQVVKPPDDGRALAAEWKQMVIDKGYEELAQEELAQ
jgi:hypothetical protein